MNHKEQTSMANYVALVTGASRGAGKGIALALGASGATVYVTGRSQNEGDAPLPGTIHSTLPQRKSIAWADAASPCPAIMPTTPRWRPYSSTFAQNPDASTCW
jgi:nucleoside-diphosphate-sugar epimerase